MNDLERYLEIWAAYAEHGVEGVVPFVTDGVVWEEYRNAPGAETYHGPDGIREINRRWQEDFDGFHFVPTAPPVELAAGTFVVRVQVRGRGRASGIQIDWDILMVARLEGGLVAHVFYADTLDEARERLA